MWGYGHDLGMMGGWGGGAFGMIIWPLVIVALIWFMRSPSYSGYSGAGRLQRPRRSSGLDILEERYARGEINREEFLQKKQEISG